MIEVKRVLIEIDPTVQVEDYKETIIEEYLQDGWEPITVRPNDKWEDWFFKREVVEKKKPGRPPKEA
jgi:hypothetical protein